MSGRSLQILIVRAIVFLGAVGILATMGFRMLVADEVERVVAVHARDKASHLAEMLMAEEDAVAALSEGRIETGALSSFGTMAMALHVAAIDVYGPDGIPLGRIDTADLVPETDHAGHDDHHEGHSSEDGHGADDDHHGHHGSHGTGPRCSASSVETRPT